MPGIKTVCHKLKDQYTMTTTTTTNTQTVHYKKTKPKEQKRKGSIIETQKTAR